MQTFLPYVDFQKSAKCLDNRRLGKQRVEGYQILRTLLGISDGWRNHPATKMWAGHTKLLRRYTQVCINEWVARGYKNTIILPEPNDNRLQLWWLGDERLHASHRSNLLRKDPDWYGRFGWSDDPAAPYWWPSQQENA